MKYLVTGGAGFIGSYLCDALIDNGDSVLCVDNLVTGSINNIKHLIGNDNFYLVVGDICNYLNYYVDGIFHLASPTAPEDTKLNEKMTFEVNSYGTKKMIDLSKEIGCKLLFVSSVKVLGNCSRVQSYIYGKRIGEQLCNDYGVKVARLASVYGPRMRKNDSRVIPTFIRQALNNETLSLWNGGKQTDSFCYVSDIIEALILFMKSNESGLVEFGYPSGITIKDLASLILKITNSESKVIDYENVLVVEECHKIPDISKAKSLFNWNPIVDIETGLTQTINSKLRILNGARTK